MEKYKDLEFTLLNGDKIKCKTLVLNGKRMKEIAEIETKFRNVKQEAVMLFNMVQSSPELIKEAAEKDPNLIPYKPLIEGMMNKSFSFNDIVELIVSKDKPNEIENNNFRRIEVLKIMIDKSTLGSKDLEDINSEPSSEFWQEQDVAYIKEVSDFFRNCVL